MLCDTIIKSAMLRVRDNPTRREPNQVLAEFHLCYRPVNGTGAGPDSGPSKKGHTEAYGCTKANYRPSPDSVNNKTSWAWLSPGLTRPMNNPAEMDYFPLFLLTMITIYCVNRGKNVPLENQNFQTEIMGLLDHGKKVSPASWNFWWAIWALDWMPI